MIARYILDVAGIAKPSYLDIGAHHPFDLSNTATFYKAGSRGVNVEPNLVYHRIFKQYRPRDVNLRAGVAPTRSSMTFYVLSSPTLSTFVRAEVDYALERGVTVVEEIEVPVVTATEIFERYFSDRSPDFLSLDTEGMDAAILRSIDFDRHAPKVICVENSAGSQTEDDPAIAGTLRGHGYRPYGRTLVNSVFAHEDLWPKLSALL